jgi:hypothetical protein
MSFSTTTSLRATPSTGSLLTGTVALLRDPVTREGKPHS